MNLENNGTLRVPLKIGTSEGFTITMEACFIIMDRHSTFQAIFGRPIIDALKAVVSTSELRVTFPTRLGERTLEGDQARSMICRVHRKALDLMAADPHPPRICEEGLATSSPMSPDEACSPRKAS